MQPARRPLTFLAISGCQAPSQAHSYLEHLSPFPPPPPSLRRRPLVGGQARRHVSLSLHEPASATLLDVRRCFLLAGPDVLKPLLHASQLLLLLLLLCRELVFFLPVEPSVWAGPGDERLEACAQQQTRFSSLATLFPPVAPRRGVTASHDGAADDRHIYIGAN